MSALRECFTPVAGIPATVPLHIEENGFPTSEPTRTYARQAQIAENMIRTFLSGNYNLHDYRWFNLRDGDSTSPNFQQQYGSCATTTRRSRCSDVYVGLIRELTATAPPARPAAARCRATLTARRQRPLHRLRARRQAHDPGHHGALRGPPAARYEARDSASGAPTRHGRTVYPPRPCLLMGGRACIATLERPLWHRLPD